PPPAAAAADEEQEEQTDPEPDQMTEDVEELKEEVKQEMKSDVKPAGVEGGVEGGQVGGVVGGTLGGVEGGVIGGQLGDGGPPPRVIHHSEVQWKKRIDPTYPMAAQGLGLGEQRCVTTVNFDPEGVPTKVEVDACPKVFHEAVREAMLKSRAYPFKVSGQKIATQTKIIFNFKDPE
ncbi:MAG TPA: energy transducer TonB, partial [Myxococcota bacterium]|nr:energy transducer TonB [Myxococcota bacterium]